MEIVPGTIAHALYGETLVRERFRHRWECNPSYIKTFEENGIIFSGKAPGREIMQVLELSSAVHPFFVGVQCHPEFLSRPLQPHPLYVGFLRAVINKLNSVSILKTC